MTFASTEHNEQVALFAWAANSLGTYPELALLHAIPNAGKRSFVVGKMMVAEGLKKGVPDVHLPVARGGYHGLWIENKWGKNKTTPEQKWWLKELAEQGYFTCVCYSFEEARDMITKYLSWRKS